jgi:hypothetical protein
MFWLVNKFPENGSYRKAFYSFRSKFRRKCKHDEKIYKIQICDKIFQNMNSDPKTFPNLFNKLNSERIQDESFNQTEFIKFFQNLNVSSENIPNNEFHDNIIQKLKLTIATQLFFFITYNKMKKYISHCRNSSNIH